jgi:hypothetical protein
MRSDQSKYRPHHRRSMDSIEVQGCDQSGTSYESIHEGTALVAQSGKSTESVVPVLDENAAPFNLPSPAPRRSLPESRATVMAH